MEEREEAQWLCLLPPKSGEMCTFPHGFGTLRVMKLGEGQGGDEDVVTSVFQISGSVESPVVYPTSPEHRENQRASPQRSPAGNG